jgi:hypothetical protein
MLTHPTDPRLVLVEQSDFDRDPLPPLVMENLEPLRQVLSWARDYLCQPHAELGRTGPVCPFTRPAMRKDLFWMAVWRGSDMTQPEIADVVRLYRDWFMDMEPRDPKLAQYKSINILFPDLPESHWKTLIEATQEELKAEYVPHGIMIGEFHPGPPDKESLWNPAFKPLKSPLPLLSIRHMVPTDFAFLKGRPDFMASYLALHGEKIPGPMLAEVREVSAKFGLTVPGDAKQPAKPAAAAGCPAHEGRQQVEAAVTECPVDEDVREQLEAVIADSQLITGD